MIRGVEGVRLTRRNAAGGKCRWLALIHGALKAPDAAHRECSAIIVGRTSTFSLLRGSTWSPFVTCTSITFVWSLDRRQIVRKMYDRFLWVLRFVFSKQTKYSAAENFRCNYLGLIVLHLLLPVSSRNYWKSRNLIGNWKMQFNFVCNL